MTLRVLGREGTLKVRTRLLVESDTRISETYEEAEFAGTGYTIRSVSVIAIASPPAGADSEPSGLLTLH